MKDPSPNHHRFDIVSLGTYIEKDEKKLAPFQHSLYVGILKSLENVLLLSTVSFVSAVGEYSKQHLELHAFMASMENCNKNSMQHICESFQQDKYVTIKHSQMGLF